MPLQQGPSAVQPELVPDSGATTTLVQRRLVPADAPRRTRPSLLPAAPENVPFHRPYLVGTERAFIERALQGAHLSGDGPLTKRCHELLSESLGVARALLTTSCTHALEMAALLLDIGPGDEVILPSYTFVSTANAFVLRGAVPVFADIRADTLNLDERKLEQLITSKTKAIVVVHYGGIACEMDTILAIAERHRIPVVEDNAHGLYGRYKERYLGTLGVLGTQSFHETKNFTCGEGGALLINDVRLVQRAEIMREKGTDRSRYHRGEVDKYTWRDLGSSYLPSDLLAGVLAAQLEARDIIQRRRRQIFEGYLASLAGWARSHAVQLPTVPQGCEPAYHLFYMIMPTSEARAGLLAHLKEHGIQGTSHYQPLHASDMGIRFGYVRGDLPVTEHVSECIVRLPLFCGLSPEQIDRVTDAVRSFEPA
jgi:dTDP-4-amino-4,6-dideoxygalactose transaminase